MHARSVRGKSSSNLRNVFSQEEPPPRVNAAGRPTTRAHMLAMRHEELAAANSAAAKGATPIMPVGRQPGAPGKTPGAPKFSHWDVMRNRPVPGR